MRDPRDEMIAWWEVPQGAPNHVLYVESPGNVVLADVWKADNWFWWARLADGALSRFATRKRAIQWCEVEVLERGILQ